jgi:DNA-binding transcriptional ArsR family regulator
MQRDELTVTREDQAVALQDVGFLSHFLTPASPSDVARRLGMAANLAHHHAKRHAELGLLEEAKREAGKVYFQLVARVFKHARALIPVEDPNYGVKTSLSLLQRHFSAPYERSDRFVEN